MYKIGELSKLCRLPVKTLRYYDSVGLLCPDMIDSFTGYRYYSAAKLSDCYRILSLKELGFSLEEIREQMNMPKEELLQLINAKQQELEKLQMQTEQRIKRLYQISKSVEEDQTMFNVIVRGGNAIRTVYVRKLLGDRKQADDIVKELKDNLPTQIMGEKHVIIDYETEYNGDSFDTGICVEICENLPKDCGYEEKVIDFREETASLICREEQYEDAATALRRFIGQNNLQIICDLLKAPDDFVLNVPNPRFPKEALFWTSVEFFAEGKVRNTFQNGDVSESPVWCWVTGNVICVPRKTASMYKIRQFGEEEFIFIQWKSGDYSYGGEEPYWYVFKREE